MSLESLEARLDALMKEREQESIARANARNEAKALAEQRAMRKKEKAERLPFLGKSTCENPVEKAWEIFAQSVKDNPNVTRSEMVNQAVKAGIATNTAKTQCRLFMAALGM